MQNVALQKCLVQIQLQRLTVQGSSGAGLQGIIPHTRYCVPCYLADHNLCTDTGSLGVHNVYDSTDTITTNYNHVAP